MKRIFWRVVRRGEMIPRGYGIAYRPWHIDSAYATLIPLNVLIGLGRWLWFSLIKPPCAWNDEQGRCLRHSCPRYTKEAPRG